MQRVLYVGFVISAAGTISACTLPGAGVSSIPKQPFAEAAINNILQKYTYAICPLANTRFEADCAGVKAGQPRPGSWLDNIEECADIAQTGSDNNQRLAECARYRNAMMADLTLAINYNFEAYAGGLISNRAKGSFYAGSLRTGLETGATLIGGEGVKTVLSSLATLTGTVQTSFDKEFYFEQTGPALIQTMRANRKRAYLDMVEKRQLSYTDYSISSAVSDLNDYYRQGTIAAAVTRLANDAVRAGNEAEAKSNCLEKAGSDIAKVAEC